MGMFMEIRLANPDPVPSLFEEIDIDSLQSDMTAEMIIEIPVEIPEADESQSAEVLSMPPSASAPYVGLNLGVASLAGVIIFMLTLVVLVCSLTSLIKASTGHVPGTGE